MSETYQQLTSRIREEFSAFPIAFAFSQKQLDEALVKLGASIEDCCSTGGGGIIRKTDSKALLEMHKRHDQERETAFQNDDVLQEAMRYELANHEYGYTGDPESALDALGLTLDDERKKRLFNLARKQCIEEYEEWAAA